MSALDTAKEIGRIAATATLGKDIIDLLEKKVALLTEQITALETENANLKQKVANLEQELTSLRPKQGGLDEDAEKILKFLFDHRKVVYSIEQIAGSIGIDAGVADYHGDVLLKAHMIGSPGGIVYAGREMYTLLARGREYVVKNLLKK